MFFHQLKKPWSHYYVRLSVSNLRKTTELNGSLQKCHHRMLCNRKNWLNF